VASETLELQTFPIWSPQPDEPAEKYQIFERYFLPYSKPSLLAAYKRFLSENGKDEQVCSPSTVWRNDCEVYQWRSRHESFWRWKNQSDMEWRQEQIRVYQAESLDTARLLRVKATEILENFDIANAGPKDAAALLRLSAELTETGLDLRDIDKAVAAVHRWGFEVLSPDSAPVGQVNGDSG